MKNQVRVLQVLIGGNTFTGVSSYLYQYYKFIDRNVVHFDFLFCRENSMKLVQDDPIFKDSSFYILNAKKNNSNDYKKIYKELQKILEENRYDIVVVNTSIVTIQYVCLLAVRKKKGLLFIPHAHNTDLILGKGAKRYKLRKLLSVVDTFGRAIIRKNSDYMFACTNDAAIKTFGYQSLKMDNLVLVRNALEIDRFSFDEEERKRIRKQLNIADDQVVYGNIGSFCKRKNQAFLIKAFKIVHDQRPNTELWLIGDGNTRGELTSMVKTYGLDRNVRFLGQRDDVNKLLLAMDCFVFTTLSEGLGIVAIEAQAASLPTIISDGVPRDVMITDYCLQLPIEKQPEGWAREMLKITSESDRNITTKDLVKAGYSIDVEAKRMTDFFSSIVANIHN